MVVEKEWFCPICGKGPFNAGGYEWHMVNIHNQSAAMTPVNINIRKEPRTTQRQPEVQSVKASGAGCMTRDWKETIMNLLKTNIPAETILTVVGAAPLCESLGVGVGRRSEVPVIPGRRQSAGFWNPHPFGTQEYENFVTYFNPQGRPVQFSSPSALLSELGIKTSGVQACPIGPGEEECEKVRVKNQFETLQIHGHTVWANGPDTPIPETAKMSQVKHFTIFDKNCPREIIDSIRLGKSPKPPEIKIERKSTPAKSPLPTPAKPASPPPAPKGGFSFQM